VHQATIFRSVGKKIFVLGVALAIGGRQVYFFLAEKITRYRGGVIGLCWVPAVRLSHFFGLYWLLLPRIHWHNKFIIKI
jgi:hypothetical protein